MAKSITIRVYSREELVQFFVEIQCKQSEEHSEHSEHLDVDVRNACVFFFYMKQKNYACYFCYYSPQQIRQAKNKTEPLNVKKPIFIFKCLLLYVRPVTLHGGVLIRLPTNIINANTGGYF